MAANAFNGGVRRSKRGETAGEISRNQQTLRTGSYLRQLAPECLESRLNLSLAPIMPPAAHFLPTSAMFGPRMISEVSHTPATTLAATASHKLPVAAWAKPQGATGISGTTGIPLVSYSSIYNCQIETRVGGQDIGYVSPAGAYVEYVINVPTAGNYDVSLGLAAMNSASLNLLVNGQQAAGYSIPVTGSWDSYQTQTRTIALAAGQNTLRFVSANGTQYNINAIVVAPNSSTPSAPSAGVTTVGAATTSVPLTSYSSISNERLETRPGGTDLGYVSTSGAYVEYALNVQTAGTYQFNFGVASVGGAAMNLLINGAPAATCTIPDTGSWDTYQTVSQNVNLPAGSVVVRFASAFATQYNLNAISIVKTAAPVTAPTAVVTNLDATSNVLVNSYSNIYNCQLETRAGGQDIGYVSPSGATVDYAVSSTAGGAFTLNLGLASGSGGTLNVLVNGAAQATVAVPATGSWDAYKTVSASLTLAPGVNTIRLASANGSQYNLNAITLAPTPAPAPSPPPTTGPAATISQVSMISLTELDVTGSAGNDTILVTQSGNTFTINCNGNVQQVAGNFGDLVVRGNGGSDSITIDSSVTLDTRIYGSAGNDVLKNFTRGKATIVAIGGNADTVQGNGINTSYWVSSADIVTSSSAEQAAGRVHVVSSFYGGVSTTLAGQSLADPVGTGSTVRLTSSSLWGTGPVITDIQQGQVADCYFLAPLGSLAQQQPDRLREMAVDLGDGTYAIQFKRGGTTTYVRVDGDLPGGPYAYGLWGAHLGPAGNQWAPIMEKAYAFFRTGAGTYSSLNFGYAGATLSDFGVANTALTVGTDANAYYNTVSTALAAGKALAYGTTTSISAGAPLIASHVYTFVSAYKDANGTPWFVLRNPWGFDGAGNDANPSDGLVTLSFAQIQANNASSVMTTS